MISGFATAAGTARYRERFPELKDSQHFRSPEGVPGANGLWFSSIGMGTYLGDPTPEVDFRYTQSATQALRSGINVLDTAINYRHQRSERNVGAALRQLIEAGELARDEVLVCSKAGFLSFDGAPPADPGMYFRQEFIERGLLAPDEVVAGVHAMSPKFLKDQLDRSRKNLGLETIDIFYVHNPETQLGKVSLETFQARLRAAFAALEEGVGEGKLRFYGTATWNGYRVRPGSIGYLSLEGVLRIAEEAGGKDHHCRFVQLPFNLASPEAYGLRNQGHNGQRLSLLETARQLGVAVIGSAPLHQGALASGLPGFISERLGMLHDWENAIQFSRSAPGLLTTLVGMSQPEHVARNIRVARQALAPAEVWEKLFQH